MSRPLLRSPFNDSGANEGNALDSQYGGMTLLRFP